MCTPSRFPAPPAHSTQQRSSCKAGADRQARWAGALGGEGSELEVLEWREEDVDIRQWWAWRRLGERERRWRGLGVEDGYRRRGEREALWGSWGEGEVDMGRQWRAWWRPGGAGAAVVGAWGGGRVRAAGGTGSPVGLLGGGAGGHGAAVARVVAPGGAGAAGAGPWGVFVAPWGAGAAQVSC